MKFTPETNRRYFEIRFSGQKLSTHREQQFRCPFHADGTPSLSLNIDKGTWNCHAGCGGGGVLDFEMKFAGVDRETARANVAELLGEKQMPLLSQKAQATYRYIDESGKLVFEKLRFAHIHPRDGLCPCGRPEDPQCSAGEKRFIVRRPDGNGGWINSLTGLEGPRPLYRLNEVLRANFLCVTEGEKDADTIHSLDLSDREKGSIVAATTNFDGAKGQWRDEYSILLARKVVVIFPDNDEPGRQHAEEVARSAYRYTKRIRIVTLPGLPEHGDPTDWINAGHSREELIDQIKSAPQWKPSDTGEPKILVPLERFVQGIEDQVDWLVDTLIERGANGVIVAEPKTGKSWMAADLAISLALGVSFLGFRVKRAVKVALVSREDNPSLTKWRLRSLYRAKETDHPQALFENLYINTREQSKQLLIDDDEQLAELVADLRIVKPEFLILDVLNTLHTKEENDNSEMRQVFARLDQIQREIGCAICVLHHFNKTGTGSMTQRMRGSSAIAGWCEFMIGITLDPESAARKVQFEMKAAQPPEPIFFRIETQFGVASLTRLPDSARDVESDDERARQRVH